MKTFVGRFQSITGKECMVEWVQLVVLFGQNRKHSNGKIAQFQLASSSALHIATVILISASMMGIQQEFTIEGKQRKRDRAKLASLGKK